MSEGLEKAGPATAGATGRWTLDDLGPPVDSPELDAALANAKRRIEELHTAADGLPPLGADNVGAWRDVIVTLEALEAEHQQLLGYLGCRRAEDPAQALVLEKEAQGQRIFAQLPVAARSLLKGLGEADEADWARLLADPALADAGLRLSELRREGRGVLSADEESFAAEAAGEGLRRWASLAQSTITETRFNLRLPDGTTSERRMAERFELLWDPRPEIRKATYDGLNEAFAARAGLLANCMNASTGFEQALAKRRGRDIVDDLMAQHRLERRTLDTLQACLFEGAPVLRRYLKLKAKLLGLPSLGVQDRSAPVPAEGLSWPAVGQALDHIIAVFDRFAPNLAAESRGLAARGWLESEMRADKRPGGFCQCFPIARQTRVFISYADSLMSVATLAHELGHAFHGHSYSDLRWWRQNAPACLAETASILCEHFIRDELFADPQASRDVRIAALCSQLDAAVNYLVRIPRDCEFELNFLAARQGGDVPAGRLSQMMRESHVRWFGDALVGDDGEPYGWAYNHIMMDPGLRLYNFPYSFGYLLSRRIADAFRAEGRGFADAYVRFLRASGSLTTEDAVAETLGFDVRSPDYWREGVRRIAEQVDDLEALMAA